MELLRGPRIEARPKRTILHPRFVDALAALNGAQMMLEFNELIDHIENGWEVPERFYRLDIDRNADRLLDETGMKHLHLGGRGSNILVYLMEFDDRVLILRIDDHAHFEDEPRGSSLLAKLGLRLPDWGA